MKITFLTYGTDGDTRPLAALAKELIRRGHEVRLLADRACDPLAREHGSVDGDRAHGGRRQRRAGVFRLVVPFAGDQFFWAERLRARGIGLACPMEEFAGADPAALLAAACAPAMRERAREVAGEMAPEDGVGTAADRILGGAARLPLP